MAEAVAEERPRAPSRTHPRRALSAPVQEFAQLGVWRRLPDPTQLFALAMSSTACSGVSAMPALIRYSRFM